MIKTHKILMYAAIFLTALAPQNVLSGNTHVNVNRNEGTTSVKISTRTTDEESFNKLAEIIARMDLRDQQESPEGAPSRSPKTLREHVDYLRLRANRVAAGSPPIAASARIIPRNTSPSHAAPIAASVPLRSPRGRSYARVITGNHGRNYSPIISPRTEAVSSASDQVFAFGATRKALDAAADLLSPKRVITRAARGMRSGQESAAPMDWSFFDPIGEASSPHTSYPFPGQISSPSSAMPRRAAASEIEIIDRTKKLNRFNQRLHVINAYLEEVEAAKDRGSLRTALNQIINDAKRVTTEDGISFEEQWIKYANHDLKIASDGLRDLNTGEDFKGVQQRVLRKYRRTREDVRADYSLCKPGSRK